MIFIEREKINDMCKYQSCSGTFAVQTETPVSFFVEIYETSVPDKTGTDDWRVQTEYALRWNGSKLVCILGRRYAAVFFEKLGKISLIRNPDQLRDLRYTALTCGKQFFGMIDF